MGNTIENTTGSTKEIAVAGSEEFVLGFQLAGIFNTFVTNNNDAGNSLDTVSGVMKNKEIGILVLDGKTMDALPGHFQEKLNKSVDPVVVSLSQNNESSDLRNKIMRAIGIDLWKKE